MLLPVCLFLSFEVFCASIWRLSNYAERKAEPYVRKTIIAESYDYVQHHGYLFFQENFSGVITSKIKGILDGYEIFWKEMHHGVITKIFKIFVNLFALMFINYYLGLCVFLWSIAFATLVSFLSIKLNRLSFIESESRHFLMGQISDKITNIVSIFTFSARNKELKSLHKQIDNDFIPKQITLYKYDFKMQLIIDFFYLAVFAFVIFYMIHLRMNHLISIGDFAFIFGITLVVANDIYDATCSLQDFASAMGDLRSALMVVRAPHTNIDIKHAKKLQVTKGMIEIKDLTFFYDAHKNIFENFNLKIQPGEKIGIVGSSGSGKSTLVSLILRYFELNSGQILIDGQDISTVTSNSLRSNIAVIHQDTSLFHRTMLENIAYGKIEASYEEVIAASKQAKIDEFVQTLPNKYETSVGEKGTKISGGQRQRISIARAILKNAPILILDEATSALDNKTEMIIQKELDSLITQGNKTVFVIAHRLSTLKTMDRIIVLDKGKIVTQGTHKELLKAQNSIYKDLWDLG